MIKKHIHEVSRPFAKQFYFHNPSRPNISLSQECCSTTPWLKLIKTIYWCFMQCAKSTNPPAKSPCSRQHFYGENPICPCFFVFLSSSCPFPFFPFPLFFFYSFPSPQMGGWGVCKDGGQTHCQCQTYIIFLMWPQVFPLPLLRPRK